jgi:hypothetical protein
MTKQTKSGPAIVKKANDAFAASAAAAGKKKTAKIKISKNK